jgi:hypothetical protein
LTQGASVTRIQPRLAELTAWAIGSTIQASAGHPEVDTALAASQTFVEQAHALHLLTGYETKIHRIMEKHQAQLKALQAERKAAHEKAAEQATQFVELAEAMDGPTNQGKISRPPPTTVGLFFLRPKSAVAVSAPRLFAPLGSTILRENCRIPAPNRMPRPTFPTA